MKNPMPRLVAAAVVALSLLAQARAQVTLEQMGELLGTTVEKGAAEGTLAAAWTFRDPKQARGFVFDGPKPRFDAARGLVLTGAESAAEFSVRPLRFGAPLRLTLEIAFADLSAGLVVSLLDGKNADLRTIAFLNLKANDGSRCRGVLRQEGKKQQTIGSVKPFAAKLGERCIVSCEIDETKLRFAAGGPDDAIEDAGFPHETFRIRVAAHSGEIAIGSLKIDGAVDEESLRTLKDDRLPVEDPAKGARLARFKGWAAVVEAMPPSFPTQEGLRPKRDGFDEAFQSWREELQREPKATSFERAARAMQSAAKAHPDSTTVWWYAGMSWRAAADSRPMLAAFETTTRQAPHVAAFWRDLGYALVELGETDRARAALERAEAMPLAGAWPHVAHARLHLENGELAEATIQLERALKKERHELIQALREDVLQLRAQPQWDPELSIDRGGYAVQTVVPARLAEPVVEQLAAFRRYLEAQFPLPKEVPPLAVWLFGREQDYRLFADPFAERSDDVPCAWQPALRTLLVATSIARDDGGFAVLRREAFEQWLAAAAPQAPAWLRAGLGEYHAATTFDDHGKAKMGNLRPGRILILRQRLENGFALVPFDRLMTMTESMFAFGDAPLRYAQSWAMAQWFHHAAPPAARKAFDAYVEAALAGKPVLRCFESTLGALPPAELAAMERAFAAFVDTLKE